jgi:CRP/FNR family transcriptional regulator, cyclic AMP receptor protein
MVPRSQQSCFARAPIGAQFRLMPFGPQPANRPGGTGTVDRRAILRNHALFAQLTSGEIDQLLAHARVAHYRHGDVIFHKASPGTGMMAVLAGQVRISAPSPDGREIVLNMINPGEIFGEIALLDGKDRTADAVAQTDCELLVIERRSFIPFLISNPEIALRLLAVLCDRLRRTTEQVEDMLFRDLPSRLAKKLLSLAATSGTRSERGVRIATRLSQRELGAMVGMSRESVNKQLRQWQVEGIIASEEGCILLADERKLRSLAEPEV